MPRNRYMCNIIDHVPSLCGTTITHGQQYPLAENQDCSINAIGEHARLPRFPVRNPVEAGLLAGSAHGRDLGRRRQFCGGQLAVFKPGRHAGPSGPYKKSPGHEGRAAATVRFRPGIRGGACSGRPAEVRASALVSGADNAQASVQPISRESRLTAGGRSDAEIAQSRASRRVDPGGGPARSTLGTRLESARAGRFKQLTRRFSAK